ncbi:hypothetical protein BKA82DRAFT_4050112 [Pisolithus tinctorius]|nr:hypothetical protein BKA82DRAFT_4050112 [Pisolithus tinctorius]
MTTCDPQRLTPRASPWLFPFILLSYSPLIGCQSVSFLRRRNFFGSTRDGLGELFELVTRGVFCTACVADGGNWWL